MESGFNRSEIQKEKPTQLSITPTAAVVAANFTMHGALLDFMSPTTLNVRPQRCHFDTGSLAFWGHYFALFQSSNLKSFDFFDFEV